MSRACFARLSSGRLHCQDGPIDLIIAIDASPAMKARAEDAAIDRFGRVLDELCGELDLLRAPTGQARPAGPIAQVMHRATLPHAEAGHFITPMAAVAGSVAEDILATMVAAAELDRAFVNNGGDIALHLGLGQTARAGLVDRPDSPHLFATADIDWLSPVRGIATSGWRGRSFSLGIADAVTVLARSASQADAATTIIANAVDLPGHPAIVRVPACEISPDSDLGHRPVTTFVGELSGDDIEAALRAGLAMARQLVARNLIVAAALHLAGTTRSLGLTHETKADRLEHA